MSLISSLGNVIPGGGKPSTVTVIDRKETQGVVIDVCEYNNLLPRRVSSADEAWFARETGLKLHQVTVTLSGVQGILLQAGAMSYMYGNLQMDTNVKGIGDAIGGFLKSKVTNESMIKPMYRGNGELGLEPSYKHFIVLPVTNDALCVDDGSFFACTEGLKPTVKVNQAGMALLGKEGGLFQMMVQGSGLLVLESKVPMDELVAVQLNNTTLSVDGNYALLWSAGLNYTVRRSGRSLMGSAVSGEGLVNSFQGTGIVWLAPTLAAPYIESPTV